MPTALNSTGTTVSITPESSLLLGEGLLGVSFLKVFGREGWAPALEWCGGTGLGIHLANLGGKETEGLHCVEGEGLGLLVRATEPRGRGLRSLGLREDGVSSRGWEQSLGCGVGLAGGDLAQSPSLSFWSCL